MGKIQLTQLGKIEFPLTLRRRNPDHALLSTQRSAGFTANSLTQVINGIYRQAGFDGASSHSRRRTFLTNLAEKGVIVRVMMALADHANMATTKRYIDLRPGVLRNAVELLQEIDSIKITLNFIILRLAKIMALVFESNSSFSMGRTSVKNCPHKSKELNLTG